MNGWSRDPAWWCYVATITSQRAAAVKEQSLASQSVVVKG